MIASNASREPGRRPFGGTMGRIVFDALADARCKPLRSMRRWAEEEVYLPEGPYAGLRFKVSRQPIAGPLLDALDSRRWSEVFICGPSQSGKTLLGHVVPACYAVAELRRNSVVGIPDLRIANDKWAVDIRPLFLSSPALRRLLPTSGAASKGGGVTNSITFANDVVLKFMSAGGDDTQRAAFTASGGVYVTEAARFSKISESSVESDPLDQLRARMASMERRDRRLVVEGTATIEEEFPYSARPLSTRSRLVVPCRLCDEWVTLDRESLCGWLDAKSEVEAAERAFWKCPACGGSWTDEQRKAAHADVRLLHDGQRIERGEVVGDPPATERLWFRWSAANNCLLNAAEWAVDEWRKTRMEPETEAAENAERKLRQFVWALPYERPSVAVVELSADRVARAQAAEFPRGLVPGDTLYLTVGVDLGKYCGHYVAIAWRAGGVGLVVDYGIFDVPTKRSETDEQGFAVEVAVDKALTEFRERCESIGWAKQGGEVIQPAKVCIDANWETDTVLAFLRRHGARPGLVRYDDIYLPVVGRGVNQHDKRRYAQPKRRGGEVIAIGERYYITRDLKVMAHKIEADVDFWKTWLHERFAGARGARGSIDLYAATAREHNTYSHHITNERAVKKQVAGFGEVIVWEQIGQKPNHYLDASAYAAIAAHLCGFRIVPEEEGALSEGAPAGEERSAPLGDRGVTMPDGREF